MFKTNFPGHNQNSRQKVVNRGVLCVQGGLTLKFVKNSTNLVFHISIWGTWSFIWEG